MAAIYLFSAILQTLIFREYFLFHLHYVYMLKVLLNYNFNFSYQLFITTEILFLQFCRFETNNLNTINN